MQLRVHTAAMVDAARLLRDHSDAVGHAAVTCPAIARDVRDPALRHGAGTLADVAGDALEVAATDLGLLMSRVRAGALVYDQVETGVRRSATS